MAATTRPARGAAAESDYLNIIHCFRAPVGGVFRHVRDLALAQADRGHRVGIICDSTTGGAYADRLLEELGPSLALGLKRLPMRRQISLSDFKAANAVYREVRSLRPDIMHGHGAKGGAYARMIGTLLRVSGIRVARIYTPHGGSLHYDRSSLKGSAYLRLERLLERFSDGLVFVSAFERDTYAAKVGTPRIPAEVVLNGLAEDEFEPIEPASSASDFLFVGTLRDLKGPDVFIDALALLRDRTGQQPTATMVGDGDIAAARAQAERLQLANNITFHDPMPARDAFPLGRILVVPSRAESLPYIVLEAAAAAVPIIATDVGGISEILDRDQLVVAGDPNALADAMAARLAAPDQSASEAGRLREESHSRFNIPAMVSGIEQLYRRCLVGR